jgi:hypothetical protein
MFYTQQSMPQHLSGWAMSLQLIQPAAEHLEEAQEGD